MKRVLMIALLMAATGCLGWPGAKLPEPPPPVAQPARPAAAVTVDQVSSNNAHQIADALGQELDREQK